MPKADSVYITPPTNTSAIDHPMMFPRVDPTQAANVPQAVTVPQGADPIHAVIEQHRKAVSEHNAALNIHCAFEECGLQTRRPISPKRSPM
jgi:hypothetical protein